MNFTVWEGKYHNHRCFFVVVVVVFVVVVVVVVIVVVVIIVIVVFDVVVVVFTIVDVGCEDKVVQHRLSPVDQLSFRMNGYPMKFTCSALNIVFFFYTNKVSSIV